MRTYTQKDIIAFTEVLYILSFIEEEYYNKIPKQILNIFKENSLKYYRYYNDRYELKVSQLTKAILCYLNLEFWCDKVEREELLKIYERNEKNKMEKYNINKIFENRKKKQYN